MEPKILTPNEADFAVLWRINPLAQEQLHRIAVERLLAETEAKLAAAMEALNASKGPAG